MVHGYGTRHRYVSIGCIGMLPGVLSRLPRYAVCSNLTVHGKASYQPSLCQSSGGPFFFFCQRSKEHTKKNLERHETVDYHEYVP